jgi:hypothetical protein
MYDAVTARNILAHDRTPEMVAGYVDRIKLAPWSPSDWALFPAAVKVEIVKKASSNAGHVLDVEPGDATPAEAPGWVRMRRAAGADPTIYVNRSTWPAVQAEFDRQGVAQPHYWIAHYNGDPGLPTLNGITAVAKQHTANFRGVDINSVADYWPGVDAPSHRPTPNTTEDEMAFGRVCPAGTNAHVDLAVVDCEKLRLHSSWGQRIVVHDILFYGDTGPNLAGTGVGGGYDDDNHGGKPWNFDPNRPGPLPIPAGATTVTVRYDAAHDWFLSAAKS